MIKQVPSAIRNSVLVKVEWEKKSEIEYGSLKLSAVHGFDSNPESTKYAAKNLYNQTKGVIVSIPLGFDPHYDIDRIEKELVVGDTVYFHYNSIREEFKVEYDGQSYYWIQYDQIFCAVRDTIVMIGGRVLVDPYVDPSVKEIEHEGRRVKVRMTKSGIISEFDVRYDLSMAVLRHIGKPMKGDPELGLKPGDIIFYEKESDFENEIEGHTYFCMTQDAIWGVMV